MRSNNYPYVVTGVEGDQDSGTRNNTFDRGKGFRTPMAMCPESKGQVVQHTARRLETKR